MEVGRCKFVRGMWKTLDVTMRTDRVDWILEYIDKSEA